MTVGKGENTNNAKYATQARRQQQIVAQRGELSFDSSKPYNPTSEPLGELNHQSDAEA